MHKILFLLFIFRTLAGTLEKSCPITNTSPAVSRQQCQVPFGISSFNDKSKEYPEERKKFNFASLDCGARILAANQGAREINSILVNAKDKYMVNQCATKDKFIELEFCQEILVESVVLANYELFSGVFKDFKIYVNHIYPASFKQSWKLIGEFTALNIKGKQTFNIKNPILWAKYLRIEFQTHYGNEYYCPFSQIKVFGTTMMEEVKAEENKVDGAFEDVIKSMPESVQDSQDKITNQDQFVQESFFKSVMKRLSALEESAVFTKSFLKSQRRDITRFLERLEDEQMKILISFLNDEWMEFVIDKFNTEFQTFTTKVEDQRILIEEKLKKLDDAISKDVYYYNLLWQIPLALFVFYGRRLIKYLESKSQRAQVNFAPDFSSGFNTASVQTLPRKRKRRGVLKELTGRGRSNTS